MPMTTLAAMEETGGITERKNMGRVAVANVMHVQLNKLFETWHRLQRFPASRWRNADWSTFEETVTDDRELAHLTPAQREWMDAYARLWNATVTPY